MDQRSGENAGVVALFEQAEVELADVRCQLSLYGTSAVMLIGLIRTALRQPVSAQAATIGNTVIEVLRKQLPDTPALTELFERSAKDASHEEEESSHAETHAGKAQAGPGGTRKQGARGTRK